MQAVLDRRARVRTFSAFHQNLSMGKQYNKVIKRRRRKAYLARRKAAAKAAAATTARA
jgi:hypothetical protein